MMKKSIISILVLLMVVSSAFAGYYNAGDTEFTVTGGTSFPVALYRPWLTDSTYGDELATFTDSGFKKVGGSATISYQGFVNNNLMLGGELGYTFAFARSSKYFAVVPLTFKATFVPVQNGKFDLNINLGAGAAFMKYNTSRYFPAPFAKISVTPIYYITSSWGIGLDVGVMGFAEIYLKNDKKDRHQFSSFFAIAPVTLSVTYRH